MLGSDESCGSVVAPAASGTEFVVGVAVPAAAAAAAAMREDVEVEASPSVPVGPMRCVSGREKVRNVAPVFWCSSLSLTLS